MSNGKVVKVSGPLVVATGLAGGEHGGCGPGREQRLIGEVLTMTGDAASIQVYGGRPLAWVPGQWWKPQGGAVVRRTGAGTDRYDL